MILLIIALKKIVTFKKTQLKDLIVEIQIKNQMKYLACLTIKKI